MVQVDICGHIAGLARALIARRGEQRYRVLVVAPEGRHAAIAAVAAANGLQSVRFRDRHQGMPAPLCTQLEDVRLAEIAEADMGASVCGSDAQGPHRCDRCACGYWKQFAALMAADLIFVPMAKLWQGIPDELRREIGAVLVDGD